MPTVNDAEFPAVRKAHPTLMAVKLQCPRCRKALSVPNKKAGGYVNCPLCNGRFWVPKDSPADSTHLEAIVSPGMPAPPPPPVAAPMASAPTGVRSSGPTAAPSASAATPFAPPSASSAPAASERKVARFITEQAAQSGLKLAEDGKLPELHLQEGEKDAKADAKSTSVSPLVLVGALVLSVVLSIALVLVDTGGAPPSKLQALDVARKAIEEDYFGSLDPRAVLEPYQVLLREAQREHARGDHKAERQQYRKVLDLLRAERGGTQRGLTGSRSRDKELEKHLNVLLSEE